jgi:hypothetical protein
LLCWVGKYGKQNVVDLQERATMQDLRNWRSVISEFIDKEKEEIERQRNAKG